MKFGEVVATHVYYNFTKFHQNRMRNKKGFFNSPFFCSEFQSVSRIVKNVHCASSKYAYLRFVLDEGGALLVVGLNDVAINLFGLWPS